MHQGVRLRVQWLRYLLIPLRPSRAPPRAVNSRLTTNAQVAVRDFHHKRTNCHGDRASFASGLSVT
jgi:hypothetical protein